ncbi:hypothetical protein Pla100_47790 [Neorhodopirellula pilleata]|uniref:Secreted protein n=1 Tax=Neorhodopirellula pilleata TaxID=2714738 RepID=A0A5C5ZX82_9BACT|nr:hypothetical protein Pla100_47790 [Neorhodopirellula pilleata]
MALILVLVLALMVGTFAASVTSLASHERRHELQRQSHADLRAAIEAVAQSGLLTQENDTMKLPLNEPSRSWIEVKRISSSSEEPKYTAELVER